MTGIRHGISTATDTAQAVSELRDAILGPDTAFVTVFCSTRHDAAELERELAAAFAGISLVGCTTCGEMSGLGYSDGGLVGISFPRQSCLTASRLLPRISAFNATEAQDVVAELLEDLRRAGGAPSAANTFAMLLIDPLAIMEERIAGTLAVELAGIALFGGSAGDNLENRAPKVLFDGRFLRDAAVLTLIQTAHPFKVFATHHFVGSGQTAIVTGAVPEHRVITELNGVPAAEEYAHLAGLDLDRLRADQGKVAPPPLMVRVAGTYYTRSVDTILPNNTLLMACIIDEGVPLSVGTSVGLRENLDALFADLDRTVGPTEVVIGVDCLWRKVDARSLGINAELGELYRSRNVIGFSSLGEQIGGMHVNHTLTGVALGHAAAALPELVPQIGAEDAESQLRQENHRLKKTVRVLRDRVERSMNMPSDTFSMFQNTILLEETVSARTRKLAEVNDRLNQELVARREIEAALLQAKAAAENANNSKTQFLAAVSHDLRQPLHAAHLLVGALAAEDLSAASRSLVGRVESALESAEEMLGDFLEVAKLDTGATTYQRSGFPIFALLAQLSTEYQPLARRRGIGLSVMPAGIEVWTDRYLLQRVLRNLIINALRHTENGRVVVGCRKRGDRARIEVWDTGPGIPADKLSDIFMPFYQLVRGRRGDDFGSGLGLTIVERICEGLGLGIDVRSQEGRGSCFAVSVPLSPTRSGDHAAILEDVAHPVVSLAGRRVMVIDDDGAALDSLITILAAWRCIPLPVRQPDETQAALAARPELFIVDYHLDGGITGLDLLGRIEAECGHPIQALVISADTTEAVRAAVKRQGYELLSKPVKPARLRAAIAHLLGPL